MIQIIILVLVSVIATSSIAYKIGFSKRKKLDERHIGFAEEEANKIINEAKELAEIAKKESILEAKDEIFKMKTESEKEIRDRRNEINNREKRLIQKEESLDKKLEQIEIQEISIKNRSSRIKQLEDNVENLKNTQLAKLQEISGYSVDYAKQYILKKLEGELVHEKAIKIKSFNQQFSEEVNLKAKKMISEAISRCASDHVADATISVVSLPVDEMKGRIIGREGRNIRTLEMLTGVSLIIDDTPETITISGFDPVRREVAKIALKNLILDGRIHPTRIEEMVQKATIEIEATMKQEGERAVIETGIHSIHPELVKLIGRLKYRTSYGQNILNHSLEVAHLCGLFANELGVDPMLARRAGLLHDIGKALDHEVEGTHVSIGVDIAKKYKEHFEVVHGIESHHEDVEPSTIISCIVKASDTISAARPGARREDLENYIKRLHRLEEIANSFEGVERSFAIQAGREIRILVDPDEVDDYKMSIIAREIVKKIEAELNYPGQIKIQMIRESRAVEFAK